MKNKRIQKHDIKCMVIKISVMNVRESDSDLSRIIHQASNKTAVGLPVFAYHKFLEINKILRLAFLVYSRKHSS